MNMREAAELLKEIAAVDNRQITPEKVAMWQGILAGIPLEIAREAHLLARRDDRVTFLEPKHIYSWAKEAAFKLDKQKEKQPEPEVKYSAQPTCREHGKLILSCDPCCHRLNKYMVARGVDTLHDFALKEIYA